jgi:hypothetical protein
MGKDGFLARESTGGGSFYQGQWPKTGRLVCGLRQPGSELTWERLIP